MNQLKGQIERVTFYSQETGFAVCRLKVRADPNLVTIVGNMASPRPGELVELGGQWDEHAKFGSQFRVLTYKSLVPATAAGIERYLGSGLVKGIGPVMAKRIVKAFGPKALDIIEGQTDRLAEIQGIGPKRIAMIKQAWDEQKEVRAVMLFLQSHGVSTAYAARIFKTYGQDSIAVVQDNPFQLAEDIYGIGFITADRIAANLGMDASAPQRVRAGVAYMLNQLADQGHVCFPRPELIEKTMELLDLDPLRVERALDALAREQKIIVEGQTESSEEPDRRMVFLKKFHVCELGISSGLTRLMNHARSNRTLDVQKALDWVQGQIRITLAPMQREAVEAALTQKVLVITGGPGTGKTTIINAILKILKKAGARTLLAAPTGRAAKRMSETTRAHSQTIHRLLDYSMKEAGFKRNNKNPLKCDVLIVDEASMIDTVLAHHLLKALPSKASLVLVGDVHQLPSVGPGNVLKDLIRSGSFCVVTLDTIFRQAQKSLIVVNAHKINQGEFPILPKKRDKGNFFFIQRQEPEDVLSGIIELVQQRIPARFGFHPLDDIQVLTPMNRGIVGAASLNQSLQGVLNPSKIAVTRGNREFRQGDKVMQIRNNYDKHTYNGDIGRIQVIDFSGQTVEIDFEGRRVTYEFSALDELVHAYAVSVHKSQGSEYPAVIIPVVTQHYVLLQRNLLYTAVTRGKRLVVLVGTKKALFMAIRTVKSSFRHTLLEERLS